MQRRAHNCRKVKRRARVHVFTKLSPRSALELVPTFHKRVEFNSRMQSDFFHANAPNECSADAERAEGKAKLFGRWQLLRKLHNN